MTFVYVDDTTLGMGKELTLALGVLATFLVCDPIYIGHLSFHLLT
jgi:hypothetical protein